MEKFNNNELNGYFVGYEMLTDCFKQENLYDGLSKALNYIKVYLKAEDVILYKLDNNKEYVHYSNQDLMANNSKEITTILNNKKEKIEKKKYFIVKFDNIVFVPIKLLKSKYIIAITNCNDISSKDFKLFMNIMNQSFSIILEKYEMFKKMKKDSLKDVLTGLDNRTSYNCKLKEIDANNKGYGYGLFDLFRLKYINDNYSHALGDDYILASANILKKYFPSSYLVEEATGGSKKVDTGTRVYRIGGDEFVVISENDNKEDMEYKAKMASNEVKSLLLEKDLTLGLNYGISYRNLNETSSELYLIADKKLSDNKKDMYLNLGINRRS